MKYDFETVVSRSGNCSSKWDQMKGWNPNVGSDIVPFSVADMELRNAPEIIEGIKEYVDKTILGYTNAGEAYYNAVCGWMDRRHSWDIKPEWILGTPGVVNAFYTAVKAFTKPGEGVILMTPVYYPMYMAVERNKRKIVRNPLIYKDNRYSVDFNDLEEKAKDPNNTLIILCSPHNPVGRVWTPEELERIGRICIDNNVVIVSDEIHFDIIMPGYKHTVFATISEEFADHSIVCTAPSKTFNLAGLQTSNIIIRNKRLRERFREEQLSVSISRLNMIGYKACELAYDKGEEWLEQLLLHIDHNRLVLTEYMEQNLSQIKVIPIEGTYLQWLDLNALGISPLELERIMHMEAQVFFDEGYVFGEEGKGFERMNIACPTNIMLVALERMKKTLDQYMRG
ncbi:MalY/PatB family protein [Lutispora saccharofermentans]|uniref:cysteine-S-conjugate beta-lyase n=1 Tax=Lutispora saccharofermentans TaxID=3024236 RepID=A0ABT1NG92_9FIRM|nr:MalY/PatB family protein [Lutispora saccharofermentans]MCQ1530249.1 pyridoxal phosphate-dependent aminotransferase [Lutispora saccharofermentans]